jgi:[ribosomal protein S5]-alanine N-acetyltransferase
MDWKTLPTIDAHRIVLRPISADDVDAFYSIFSDPQVMRYWSTLPIANTNAARKLIDEIDERFARHESLKWGVALRSDNTLIGTTTLHRVDFDNRRAEIGYALGSAHWGKGYMHEALQATLGYAFQILDLHRIEADVDPRNQSSIKTLERLGFQREGLLRERWQVGGEIQDSLFYGLLKRDRK